MLAVQGGGGLSHVPFYPDTCTSSHVVPVSGVQSRSPSHLAVVDYDVSDEVASENEIDAEDNDDML